MNIGCQCRSKSRILSVLSQTLLVYFSGNTKYWLFTSSLYFTFFDHVHNGALELFSKNFILANRI